MCINDQYTCLLAVSIENCIQVRYQENIAQIKLFPRYFTVFISSIYNVLLNPGIIHKMYIHLNKMDKY